MTLRKQEALKVQKAFNQVMSDLFPDIPKIKEQLSPEQFEYYAKLEGIKNEPN